MEGQLRGISCVSAPLGTAFCLSFWHQPAASDVLFAFNLFKHPAILINWLLFQEPTSNTLVIFHGEAETTG
jgi:hypothetical protein